MKVSLAWLNQYLDRPVAADEAERLLTHMGFPIESRDGDLLDVEVTSNRGDCLSHVGLARELAAAGERTLRMPDLGLPPEHQPAAEVLTRVANDATDLCPLYTARVITGVKVAPSPSWLVEALESIGLRPVNNVVDVTNYVLMESGQPLHAFDLNRLTGRRIVVRRAARGEPFTAIDGTKHVLGADMLVIADEQAPVAVAGVMGGLESEVGEATTDLLLESAVFDPLSVRTTSRALKLASDSSYRFERGVDPAGVERASRRAAQLIVQLAGGQLAAGVVVAGHVDTQPRTVALRPARCRALLGEDIPDAEQVGHLERLGLSPRAQDGSIVCQISTHRLDLQREVDLIEEVARSRGLEGVPQHEKMAVVVRPVQPALAARRQLDEVLVAHGYHETVTPTFLEPRFAQPFAGGEDLLRVDPQRRKADPVLRPSVLASLLSCRKLNQDRGNAPVNLYEVAAVWPGGREKRVLAMLADAPDKAAALRQIKAALAELAERLGGDLAFEPRDRDDRCEVAAAVQLGGAAAGVVGVLRPAIQELFDLQTPVVAAELDLEPLVTGYPPARAVGELPRFPGIERDLSVIVAEAITWRQFEQAVRDVAPAMLESVTFLDTYRGKPISKGCKSVSFRMTFRDPAKTLKHEQVDPQVAAVVAALQQAVNAELRA